MQLSSEVLNKVSYLVGSADIAAKLPTVPAMTPFADMIVAFLNDLSREIMRDPRSKAHSDVVTFGFWIRKGAVLKQKERFIETDGIHLGKGVVFHIAPSNVPVNFAYSLVAGLICGNANVVRVSSKDFPQVEIITDAINRVLKVYEEMKAYVLCIRYRREKDINDLFSSIADVRVVWGGDNTISELRSSPLPPRSGEITFADRYSLAVIDADSYMEIDNKNKVAKDFYNDTFLSDQNACTSPRIIIWTGSRITEAKDIFWKAEHEYAEKKYKLQAIQSVNKLTKSYFISAQESGVKVEEHTDNLIIRVTVSRITDKLIDFFDNSGLFYEYNCSNVLELFPLCNDNRCQTISYVGDNNMFESLIRLGLKGVDRIVPVGKTMEFEMIWDGNNLVDCLTRVVMIR